MKIPRPHRQHLPKGVDLGIYSHKYLDKIADGFNNCPRQTLGFERRSKPFNRIRKSVSCASQLRPPFTPAGRVLFSEVTNILQRLIERVCSDDGSF